MALDPRFIASVSLADYFVDKANAQALSGGKVTFYQDDARAVPKLVYQLTGAPPNYTYTAIADPITLSANGTFQDNAGNNIAVYYFPYDAFGNLQLYYVTVTDSFGNEQFVRQAWPPLSAIQNQNTQFSNMANQITNPQFANILFGPSNTLSITSPGAGTQNVVIAPDWTLNITTNGVGTVTVTRNVLTGANAYPYNPPYTLTVTPGANVTGLTLTQKLPNTPDIWSPQAGGTNGYVASSILLAPNSEVTINYVPSTGAPQQLLTANNLLGAYSEFTNTVQLAPATNPDNATVGFVTLQFVLNAVNPTTLGNIQVLGVDSNIQTVTFDQSTVNRQVDQMFNYYKPLLEFKPIPSYLVGWDFPLNPAQFLGPTSGPFATGAGTSNYVWDQTIVFQSANSGVSISQNNGGALVLSMPGAAGSQAAVIQYLPAPVANEILNTRLSSMISALAHAPYTATVSLWYTANANLPSTIGTHASLVTTLDANGHPSAVVAGWHEVPRSGLGNAQFTIGTSPDTRFNNYGFSGWDMQGIAAVNTATFFAIVVGTQLIPQNGNVSFRSISLVPGDVPTIPAPESIDRVYDKCKYYYQTTFPQGTLPAQAIGFNTGYYAFAATKAGAVAFSISATVPFSPYMYATPTITFYNPINADAQVVDLTTNVSCTGSSTANLNNKGFYVDYTGDAGAMVGYTMGVHYTADARLGQ